MHNMLLHIVNSSMKCKYIHLFTNSTDWISNSRATSFIVHSNLLTRRRIIYKRTLVCWRKTFRGIYYSVYACNRLRELNLSKKWMKWNGTDIFLFYFTNPKKLNGKISKVNVQKYEKLIKKPFTSQLSVLSLST